MSESTRRRITFVVLAAAVLCFALLQSLMFPVLPDVQERFDSDQSTVTWLFTGYLLSASIATPLLGRVGDVMGKTRMLTVTLLILSLGSLIGACAPNVWWLIVARVIQGFGGGVLPLAFGITRDVWAKPGTVLSVIASLGAVGSGVGLVLAGPLVDTLGFHSLFWVPMIVTATAAIASHVALPEGPTAERERLPIIPAILLTAWLICLLLAISRGNEWGWSSPGVVALFVATPVLSTLWFVAELRAPVPMIDPRLMKYRGFWTANIVSAFVGFAMFASFANLPQLLQTPPGVGYGFGATLTESSHMLLPWAVASFCAGFASSHIVRLVGPSIVITSGIVITAFAFLSLAFFHDETWQVYVATTMQGLGTGLAFSSIAGVVITSVPHHQTGVASGINANIRTIGGSIGTAVMTSVVTANIDQSTGFPDQDAYRLGFTILAVGLLVAAAAAGTIPRPPSTRKTAPLTSAGDAALSTMIGSPAPSARKRAGRRIRRRTSRRPRESSHR